MRENFITYEQALALKELGFNEPCMSSKDMHNGQGLIQIPLFQQAFRWFRENHSINGIVSYYGKGQWNIEILDYKGNELIQIEDNTFWSYEEAESACINKLIEIIKEKKSIIPQEEPKPGIEGESFNVPLNKSWFPKQETLEEAAQKCVLDNSDMRATHSPGEFAEFTFKEGVGWHAEQILEFLYSEITERRDYSASKMCEKVIEFIEQNKKK